jgi:hypothetical protein
MSTQTPSPVPTLTPKQIYVRSALRVLGLLLGTLIGIAILLFVVSPTLDLRKEWKRLDGLLAQASRVTVTEFVKDRRPPESDSEEERPERVLKQFDASPAQVQELRNSIGASLTTGVGLRNRCFDPHHRLGIHAADGKTETVEICFLCQNYRIGEGGPIPLPAGWSDALSALFTRWGMNPRTSGEYEAVRKK